ncbi:MAG: PaaI family thioesterase [Acidimicrobiales bacterium]
MTSPEQLNAALRDLIQVVRTAEIPEEEAASAIEAVRRATAVLRPHVVDDMRMQLSLHPHHLITEAAFADHEHDSPRHGLGGLDPSDYFPYSPVTGALNPIAPPCRMWRVDGDPVEIHGEVTFGDAYNGAPDTVHGGALAAVLDELLGAVAGANGLGGFTGTLVVRYRARSPLGEPIALRGWLTGTEGRKVYTSGELREGKTLLAEADGVFIRSDMHPMTA